MITEQQLIEVGFIAKLPHHLVEAFQATLEELSYADLLIHVIDAADPEREAHIQVVDRLIAQLANPETPVLRCYNKAELVEAEALPVGQNNLAISAKTGQGLEQLLALLERELCKNLRRAVFLLPYSMGGMVETLHDKARVFRVDYTAEGIEIEAEVDEVIFGRLAQYEVK
jgi:GTP-binding protein HflX